MERSGLRVALVSTPFVATPPVGYGGTELVVADLACALQRRGVDVVVYATGDSELAGIEVRSYFTEAHWPPDPAVELTHATWALRDAARDPVGFDLIHFHCCSAIEAARLSPYPVICSLHHDRDAALTEGYRRAPQVRLVAVSKRQAELEPAHVSHVVLHGLDPSRYRRMADQGYLLFLGRYDRVKGAKQAIEVAHRAGLPLVMAGSPHEKDYFEAELKPHIDDGSVIDVGPVAGAAKLSLIARARALVFPIQWEEPFGLVMIEALLSGVPVLANARGSVPEVIEDGVTGVICDDPAEMVAAARISDKFFNRERIQEIARRRFSSARMADDYLRVYRAELQRVIRDDAALAEA